MPETTVNAIITTIGSLLGGFVGAYATIKAAEMKEKSQFSNGGEAKSLLFGIIVGAIIGAIITTVILLATVQFEKREG